MATGNFLNNNASRIFAVDIQEDFEYEDLKSNIQAELNSLSENDKLFYDFTNKNEFEHGNRNFCGTIIGTLKTKDKVYKDFNCFLNIETIIRSGYYGGVNIDWDVNIDVDGETFQLDEEIYIGDSKQDIHYSNLIQNWKVKEVEKAIEKIEKIFSELSIPLVVKARFSNGETIYEKA